MVVIEVVLKRLLITGVLSEARRSCLKRLNRLWAINY